MKRKLLLSAALLCVATSAIAADLPVKALKAPPVPVANWTGCHVGGDIGGAWVSDTLTETSRVSGAFSPFNPNTNGKASGVKGGGYVGCDWQFDSRFVAGIEGDIEGADIRSRVAYLNTGNPPDTYEARVRSQASIRGRIGMAADSALFYLTGGAAFADIRHTYVVGANPNINESFNNNYTSGVTIGAGVDYMFTPQWIARLEVRFSDFGKAVNLPAITFPTFTESHYVTESAVRVGVAYKFGAPLLAKF